jgi:hypothetical protein
LACSTVDALVRGCCVFLTRPWRGAQICGVRNNYDMYCTGATNPVSAIDPVRNPFAQLGYRQFSVFGGTACAVSRGMLVEW